MLKSVIIMLVFASIGFFIGLCIVGAAIWALADTTTLIYYARRLTSGRGDLLGIYMTLVCPLVFGLFSFIPFLLTVLLTVTENEDKFVAYAKALIGILFIMIFIETPFVITPMALIINTTPNKLSSALISSMNSDFIGLPYSWSENRDLSLIWDKIMISNGCCGISGTSDFTSDFGTRASTWYSNYRSYTLRNGTTMKSDSVKLPLSCCVLSSQTILTSNDYYNIESYLLNELCPVTVENTHSTTGCFKPIFTYITYITISFFVVQLFMIICFIVIVIGAIYIDCYQPQFDVDSGSRIKILPNRRVYPQGREYNQFNRYNNGFSKQPGISLS